MLPLTNRIRSSAPIVATASASGAGPGVTWHAPSAILSENGCVRIEAALDCGRQGAQNCSVGDRPAVEVSESVDQLGSHAIRCVIASVGSENSISASSVATIRP
jgi:hypothetical protein